MVGADHLPSRPSVSTTACDTHTTTSDALMPQDRRNALAGIDILRKICNHPDLLQRRQWEGAGKYGDPARSGKLTVALKARLAPE